MKKKKMIFMILAIVWIVLFVIGGGVGNYFYNLALNPNSDKSMVFEAPNNQSQDGEANDTANTKWSDTVNWEDKYICSDNEQLNLHAYCVKQEKSDLWAIIVHGYCSEGKEMFDKAEKFYQMGYNVLIPDLRAHGQSEGNYIAMGWHDRLDLIAWTNQIILHNEDAQIVLYGVSMGASTVMMASGENLPNNVKVIIEDCGYTSVEDEFTYQLKEIFGLPKFPIIHLASMVTQVRAGYNFKEASAIKQVAKSNTPILFIHGNQDTFVPSYMIHELYEVAKCPKEKLIIEGAGHAESASVNPELYWNTIQNFLEQHIGIVFKNY